MEITSAGNSSHLHGTITRLALNVGVVLANHVGTGVVAVITATCSSCLLCGRWADLCLGFTLSE